MFLLNRNITKLWQNPHKTVKLFLFYLKLPSARIEAMAKNQCPSVRNLTNKPGYSHTTEYYAAIKMSGIALWIASERSLNFSF